MTNNPLISIGLCTYNGESFLREQLDSLVSQTYSPFEIRIRDDSSDDKTVHIIREYQSKYSFIHLTQNVEKLGVQRNFEAVFLDCDGEFIAPCDQDDIWFPQKLEKLFNNIGSQQISYHDSLLIDQNGNSMNYKMSDKFQLKSYNQQEPFLFFNCVSGHSMLFRKSLLKFALPFPKSGFYDHWLAFVALGRGTIGYCPEVLVKYRQHSSNQTDLLGTKKKLPGSERVRLRISRENSWLEVCSKFASSINPNHPFNRLKELALLRENSFFSFALGLEIWKSRGLMLGILPYSTFAQLAFAFRYSIGLKTKNLFYASR